MPEITFSIVGTAGRGDDAKRLSRNHFDAMVIVAESLIDQFKENNYEITHLVSGGAAWADHVAVKLFLKKKVPNLRLFLPCEFEGGSFHDTGERGTKNPGGTLNYYHKKFQLSTNINSLTEIQIARAEGAELLPCRGGFFGRNAMVAKSDFILACTFGDGHVLKDGGTANTVKGYLERVRKEGIFDKSFHYDLNSGKIHIGCIVPKENKDDKLKKELATRFHIPLHQIVAAHSSP
jgi:hypothetical protein